jgi:hypothetical protein
MTFGIRALAPVTAAGLAVWLASAPARAQPSAPPPEGYRCAMDGAPASTDLLLILDPAGSTVRWGRLEPGASPAAGGLPYPGPAPQPAAFEDTRVTTPFVIDGRVIGVAAFYPSTRGVSVALWTSPDPAHPFWTMPTDTPAERHAYALAGWKVADTGRPVRIVGARCTRYPPPPPTASATPVYATAFTAPSGWRTLSLMSLNVGVAPERLASLIPLREDRFGMAELRCADITPAGRLSGCEVAKVEPEGEGYEAAATALAKGLSVSQARGETVAALQGHVRFVSVHFRLDHNVEGRATRGPCWPPYCAPVLAPPPPPPPPK